MVPCERTAVIIEAEAKLASDEGRYNHLKAASATPGAVAGNDIEVAQRTVEADRARVRLYEENEKAAQAQVASLAKTARAVGEAGPAEAVFLVCAAVR